jgi:glycosyltransferase involved in cell wall biosynthesis
MRSSSYESTATIGKPCVGLIYHFYPHYRKAIVERLARSKVADFEFVGDDHEYLFSIEPASFSDHVRFRLAPTHHLFGPFMWQWGAIRWALHSSYDTLIMHSVPNWPCTWIGAALARLLGKRVLFWGHGFLHPPRGIKGLLRRAFHLLANELLLYSHLSKSYAIDAGWAPERVHVIYNSLDLGAQCALRDSSLGSEAHAREIRRTLFGNEAGPVLVCSTRLIAMRRLDLLLEAMSDLRSRGVSPRLILIGDGPERNQLERIAQKRGLQVHFEGACYDEARIAELIMASTLTVAPGKVGLTAIHSMTYGVPVVSHGYHDDQGPEWEAIIPGKTGGFFEPGDVRSLANAISPWIQGEFPEACTRTACKSIVGRFWNPEFQAFAIERAVMGFPADDLAAPIQTPAFSPESSDHSESA